MDSASEVGDDRAANGFVLQPECKQELPDEQVERPGQSLVGEHEKQERDSQATFSWSPPTLPACGVCSEGFREGDGVCCLPCAHTFHAAVSPSVDPKASLSCRQKPIKCQSVEGLLYWLYPVPLCLVCSASRCFLLGGICAFTRYPVDPIRAVLYSIVFTGPADCNNQARGCLRLNVIRPRSNVSQKDCICDTVVKTKTYCVGTCTSPRIACFPQYPNTVHHTLFTPAH